MADNKPELQRGLEARHIRHSITKGTIGVGLFMGAASTLKWAGPSVLLAYIIAGLFVFFIMRSMGEMLFLEPVTGSFAVYAHRYMSPFFGYLTAWSYWFMWMAVGISEITAIGVYVQFWFPEMAQWIPALIAVALVALANLAAVRLYGEIEFWFAMIKVTTIIVMIVIGLAIFLALVRRQSIGLAISLRDTRLAVAERVPDRAVYCGGVLPGRGADWHYCR